MKASTVSLFASLALLTFCLGACGSPEGDPSNAASVRAGAEESGMEQSSASEEGTTTYEPAYPADVSTEELTDEDVSQQVATHAHGDGEEHAHGEGDEHAHEGGEDHAHDEAGDPDHEEEDPPHGP